MNHTKIKNQPVFENKIRGKIKTILTDWVLFINILIQNNRKNKEHEENIPAEQQKKKEKPWIFNPHEEKKRA
jgi:hypothetical protein